MPKPRSNKRKKSERCPSLKLPGASPDIPKKHQQPSSLPSSQAPEPESQGQLPLGRDIIIINSSSVSPSSPSSSPPSSSCIENRWNGPRVLDVVAFVTSEHATAPNVDDVTCAVYAMPEVRQMILKMLPEENALILWYNKSRKSARICPACRRFYTVGDILLPHLIDDQSGSRAEYVDPRNLREKRISGLCSLMCFGIASYNWPGSIGAWGKHTSELDARTRAILCGPGANIADDGMGAFMKMSRMENLLEMISTVYSAH